MIRILFVRFVSIINVRNVDVSPRKMIQQMKSSAGSQGRCIARNAQSPIFVINVEEDVTTPVLHVTEHTTMNASVR
jgi:hypothetical protein